MKKFKCHKIVEAGKITDIVRLPPTKDDALGMTLFTLTSGEKIAKPDHCYQANADIGQYLVRYEDGYTSISPAKAFEEGYTEINEKLEALAADITEKRARAAKERAESGYYERMQRDAAAYGPDLGDFGFALEWLRAGKAVARAGWNGKRMFVYLVPANAYPAQTDIAKARFGEGLVPYNAYMALVGTDGRVSTWVPSSTDVLAEDWAVYSVDSIAHDWAHSTAPEQSAGDKFMDNMQQLGELKTSLRGAGVPVDKIDADMNKSDDDKVEARLQELGKDAPRVRPEDLTANIVSAEYVKHVTGSGQILRWAILITQSGFAVTGKPSAAVCAENDDEQTGLQVAYDNARAELWTLMGYALKEELHRRAKFDAEPKTGSGTQTVPAPGAAFPGYSTMQPHHQRVVDEQTELLDKANKLNRFFNTGTFNSLPLDERERLHRQLTAMYAYSDILNERIRYF